MRRFFLFILASAALIPSFLASAANDTRPQRIISINLCLDALLLKLVEPGRINSLYYLSGNPQFSSVAEQAKHFYLNRGLAEDIVPRNPDLIVSGDYTSAELKLLLSQLGLRVENLPLPRGLGDITSHIRHLGQLTGNSDKAETLVKEVEETFAHLDALLPGLKPVPAFWYSSNGVVVGADTLENEIMARTGFHNLALDLNISGFKQLDLEELMLAGPKVIIVEASDVQAFSLAQEYLQHPALHSNGLRIIRLPTTLSCIAPVAADAMANLMQQRQQLDIH
jgi:iron complex transport system substrate-binding protein